MDIDLSKSYRDLDEAWDQMNQAMKNYDEQTAAVENKVRAMYKGSKLTGDGLEFRITVAKGADDLLGRYMSQYNWWRGRVNTLIAAIRLSNEQQIIEKLDNITNILVTWDD